MVTEQDVEKAFDFLRDSAKEAAEARAHRVYLEEGRKRIKALIMSEHKDLPVSAQEREAYSDPRYETHLEGLRIAVERDERFRWLKDAAIAKIDAYRTFSANQRGSWRAT